MKKCPEFRILVRPTELGSRQVEDDPSQEDDGNLYMQNPRLSFRTKRTRRIPVVSLHSERKGPKAGDEEVISVAIAQCFYNHASIHIGHGQTKHPINKLPDCC
jgi:hypothetical protein